jgi:hypothetical protein
MTDAIETIVNAFAEGKMSRRHLGMSVIPAGDPATLRLMACGPHVLNLFKASEARMDHVCFTVPDYDPRDAARD